MKKNTIFSSWICKFLVFTFLVILVGSGLGRSSEVYAASKVNFDRDTLSELLSDPDIGYSLKNRIGGMTVVPMMAYPSFYAFGNQIAIGVNEYAEYGENYVLITNSGNRRVKILGVAPGMTYGKAQNKILSSGFQKSRYSNIFYWGNAATLTLNLKNGRVTGWRYVSAPTS